MKDLLRYLDESLIQKVQHAFSAVAECPVSICDLAGREIVNDPGNASDWNTVLDEDFESINQDEIDFDNNKHVPILLAGEIRGFVKTENSLDQIPQSTLSLLKLMSLMITKMCADSENISNRIEQLLAVHRVSAKLTGGQTVKKVLDTIVKTAGSVIGAKSSTIRLIEPSGDKLTIKAGYNVSEDYLLKGAILLSDSEIDQQAVSTHKPVYMENMATDPRVLYPQEAQMEGFVSGICVPMIFNQKCEGLLRIYMDDFYKFDWFELQLAQTVANTGAAAIVHARDAEEALLSERMKKQLSLAGEVQRRMIPSKPPALEGFEFAYDFVPTYELGGDFFDFIPLPCGRIGFVICDVVGKGVRASLLMSAIRASLRAHSKYLTSLSEVIEAVNQDLCADTVASDFATMFFGVLEKGSSDLHYVCAGHTPAMIGRGDKVLELHAGGGVLGILADMPYQAGVAHLEKDDLILLYTDGLNEATNFKHEQYGRKRIAQALKHCNKNDYSAKNTVSYCLWDMRRFVGLQNQQDDTTVIGVKVV